MKREGESPYGIPNTEVVNQVMGVSHGRTHIPSLEALVARLAVKEVNQSSGVALKYGSPLATDGNGEHAREVWACCMEATSSGRDPYPVPFMA